MFWKEKVDSHSKLILLRRLASLHKSAIKNSLNMQV